MRRRKRERLHKLDMLLGKFGYPVIEPESLDKPFEEWHVRLSWLHDTSKMMNFAVRVFLSH